MSRTQERRASRGKGRYYPGLWEDILTTWEANTKVFHWGVGQSTLAFAVRCATGRTWPSHHIRKQLIYAINAGFVRYIRPDEKIDGRLGQACTRFMLLKSTPLPKPGEPLVSNVADIVEGNGKTIRENNRASEHKIALGTLVEIPVTPENEYCFACYRGVRLFVVSHERDCDQTPLYGLSPDKDLFKDVDLTNQQENAWARMNMVRGITERDIRPVDLKQEEWPRVPPKGASVVFNHPITPLNPSLIFRVHEIDSSRGKIAVKGKHTCWVVVNETSIRPPTAEEVANPDNYHPDDL